MKEKFPDLSEEDYQFLNKRTAYIEKKCADETIYRFDSSRRLRVNNRRYELKDGKIEIKKIHRRKRHKRRERRAWEIPSSNPEKNVGSKSNSIKSNTHADYHASAQTDLTSSSSGALFDVSHLPRTGFSSEFFKFSTDGEKS